MVPLGLLAGGGASSLFCTTVLQDNRREKTRGERKSSTLRDQEPAAAELDANAAAPCTTTPGRPVPPGKSTSVGRGGRKGVLPSKERGWKWAELLYSPVRVGQLVGGRRRDERSAAVPIAGVRAARQRRWHLQQRHVGRGQVKALTRPWAVRDRAGRRGLGHWLQGHRLCAGRREECGLWGGAQWDVGWGAKGPWVGGCLLGGDQRWWLGGEAGGTVGRSSEVRVLMML